MLKLEPREATQIVIPADELVPNLDSDPLAEAVTTMQRWRHYV